jgi:hypothetical protein
VSHLAVEATPMSRAVIAQTADKLRSLFKMDNVKMLPIVEIAELILPRLFDDYFFIPSSQEEMGNDEGKKLLGKRIILIRDDVYEGACMGIGRDRFTITHEISHLILHSDDRLVMNRSSVSVPAYKNPEWQANTLSSFLLMPKKFIIGYNHIEDICKDFGVSIEAAEIRMEVLAKYNL